MSRSKTILKACIPCFGTEHRELTARVGAMKYVIDRYLDGDIGANLIFGFEKLHDNSAVPPSILKSTHDLLKRNDIDMIMAGLQKTNDIGFRLDFIDNVATHHMIMQCKEYGLPFFQLDSNEVTNQIEKDTKHLSDTALEASMPLYDELRTEAMLENITKAISSQKKNSFCVLFGGMAHLPILTTRLPRLLSNHNINAQTTSLSLVSDQGMNEIEANIKYPKFKKHIEQVMENFVTERTVLHQDKDHKEIFTALKNNAFARFAENGKPLDDTLKNKIDGLIKFLNEKETTLNPEMSQLKETAQIRR